MQGSVILVFAPGRHLKSEKRWMVGCLVVGRRPRAGLRMKISRRTTRYVWHRSSEARYNHDRDGQENPTVDCAPTELPACRPCIVTMRCGQAAYTTIHAPPSEPTSNHSGSSSCRWPMTTVAGLRRGDISMHRGCRGDLSQAKKTTQGCDDSPSLALSVPQHAPLTAVKRALERGGLPKKLAQSRALEGGRMSVEMLRGRGRGAVGRTYI